MKQSIHLLDWKTVSPFQSAVSAIIAVAGEGPLEGRPGLPQPMVKGQLPDSWRRVLSSGYGLSTSLSRVR